MSADDTSNAKALNALGHLTATFQDNHLFSPTTKDYLAAVATDGKQVIRLATGITALARLLIGMTAAETGVTPEETLEQLGRRVQQLFSGQE